jgi:hypothetical protein
MAYSTPNEETKTLIQGERWNTLHQQSFTPSSRLPTETNTTASARLINPACSGPLPRFTSEKYVQATSLNTWIVCIQQPQAFFYVFSSSGYFILHLGSGQHRTNFQIQVVCPAHLRRLPNLSKYCIDDIEFPCSSDIRTAVFVVV